MLFLQYENTEPKKGCLLGNFAAEISEVSEECRLAMGQSVEKFKEILVQQLGAAQRECKVRKDLTTEEIADLLWNCWQGSLLRMKIEKSTIPLRNVMKVLNTILAE
jgi:TetR/AcrR family transcriptional repressor of nem operon